MSPKNPEIDRILQEFVDRRGLGESPSPEEYTERYPHLADELRTYFATLETLDRCVVGRGAQPPSETVLGDFRIMRELGRGGMGVVFLAEQVSLRRLVALKLLGAPSTQRYETVERFRREAEIAARLHHPNLVSVYAVGERQGYCFFAMEYVEGVTLARLLARLREFGTDRLADVDIAAITAELAGVAASEPDATPTPTPQPTRHLGYFGSIARIVGELADGLAYAHARGVIHRDVKPSNILLTRDLAPQLADFGIARDIGQKTLSLTGDLVGTPYYMSPELAMAGRIPVDHRTDVYSLGVTLFEMLALKVPFPGSSSAEVLRKILLEPTPSPRRFNSRVPRDLQVIALKAMEKDPGHRYANANEMAEDLRRFLRFEPIHARTPGAITVAARFLKRHRVGVVTILAVLVGGSATGAYVVSRIHADRLEDRMRHARELVEEGQPTSPWSWLRAKKEWLSIVNDTKGSVPEASLQLAETERRIVRAKEDFLRRADDLQKRPGNRSLNLFLAGQALDSALNLVDAESGIEERAAIRIRRDVAFGFYPVTISSEPSGATVNVHPIDVASGDVSEGSSVGRTPIALTLKEGTYWIVITADGVGFGEYAWTVSNESSTWKFAARIRPTPDAIADMVQVPAGRYRIGIDPDPRVRPRLDELRQTEVDVPSFYIDRTEVSNEQYARFVHDTRHRVPESWRKTGQAFLPGTENHPVADVSWDDAREYAEWAGKRLPTQNEWEIACRGADSRLYPWGNEFVDANATMPVSMGDTVIYATQATLAPVDSLPQGRSPFGLYHMADNVAEWVWDRWTPCLDFREGSAPIQSHGERVIRGVWVQLPEGMRCLATARAADMPDRFWSFLGFRCAKSANS